MFISFDFGWRCVYVCGLDPNGKICFIAASNETQKNWTWDLEVD